MAGFRFGPGEVIASFDAYEAGDRDGSGQARRGGSAGNTQQRAEAGGLEEIGEGQMRYLVVIEKGAKSFGAYVPDLPGCVAAGETRDEALKLIREAIEFHIEGLKQEGQPVPPPSSTSEVVDVQAA